MRYIVLYKDGSMTFYDLRPSADSLNSDYDIYYVSSQTTVAQIMDWIANNYVDTGYIKKNNKQ